MRGLALVRDRLGGALARYPVEVTVAAIVFGCTAFFFQGGGWNQNSHYATTVALVERGTLYLDAYRDSTGDLSATGDHVASNKAIGTSIVAVPGYLLAKLLTWPMSNRGDLIIVRAYLTSLFCSGVALAALAVALYRVLRRRLAMTDAALVALSTALATPLWPNSTMLTSHALASFFAVAAFAVLSGAEERGPAPRLGLLVAAGALAALPATVEYLTGLILIPLGLYALWLARPRWRVVWFGLGVAGVALVPLAHHALLFGDPFTTGYASMVTPAFRAAHGRGWYGFDGLSLSRLYELTFGSARGAFFLSPFLLAGVPGLVRLVRDYRTRTQGLVAAGVAWLVLLMVASFTHWHSGSATGSRYALLFVTFSAFGVGALMTRYRGWILVGMALGFAFMVLATSVTAIPPTPPDRGELVNVVSWWWERFAAGKLASWQQPILVEAGVGTGQPTLPFAFNLGQLLGLRGIASLLPLGCYLGITAWMLRRAVARAQHALPSSSLQPPA